MTPRALASVPSGTPKQLATAYVHKLRSAEPTAAIHSRRLGSQIVIKPLIVALGSGMLHRESRRFLAWVVRSALCASDCMDVSQAVQFQLLEAMIARRVEGNRPGDADSEYWINRHWAAVKRSLDEMERTLPVPDKPICIGDIATAVALAQLLFRFGDQDWRPGRAKLTSWFEELMQRPSLAQTHPVDHERSR